MPRFYTKEEDDYLRNNYLTKSKAEMAKDLNRTYKSIEKRLLSVLKLKKSYKDMGLTRKKEEEEKNNKFREQYRGQVPNEWFSYPSTQYAAEQHKTFFFFTGKKCEKGHLDIRRTKGRGCVTCIDEQAALFRKTEKWKEWRKEHRKKPEQRKIQNEERAKRMKDPVFHIRVNTSLRITNAMKSEGRYKPAQAEKIIGTSWEKFINHISKQFDENMTLNNYGLDGWHLDHIRPCESFDLLDDNQLYVCFNWRNYQPLWGVENLEKQDFYTKEDEKLWIKRMRDLGFEGELFTLF